MSETPAPAAPQRPEVFSAKRRRLSDLNLVLMVLAVCAIIIEMNFISFRHYKRWDFTGEFALSDRMQNLLKTLASDVKIYCFMDRGAGLELQVRDVVDELEQYTDKLKIEFLDPYLQSSELQAVASQHKLEAQGLRNTMLFIRGDKTKVFEYRDMVEEGFNPRFLGEIVFYSGINTVISTVSTKVYFSTGHGEQDIFEGSSALSMLVQAFSAEAWEADKLALPQVDAIPDDCSLLVIAGPGEYGRKPNPFGPHEADLIDKYLARNGRLLLLIDPQMTFGRTKNPETGEMTPPMFFYADCGLEEVLFKWGVDIRDHGVILDRQMAAQGDQWQKFVVTEFPKHAITKPLQDFIFLLNFAHRVEPAGQGDMQKTVLFQTSEKSFYERAAHAYVMRRIDVPIDFSAAAYRNLHSRPQQGGPYAERAIPFGVAAVKRDAKAGKETAKLVVIGNSSFLSYEALRENQVNWMPFMNAVEWLLRDDDKLLAPPPPRTNQVKLTAPQQEQLFWLVVAIMPGVALLLGACVWWVRRS